MKQLLNAITIGEPKRLVKPVVWNALANLSHLLPFICLVAIVDEIYTYYLTGSLDARGLWMRWGVMLACFALSWLLENIACKLTYRDGFMASADGRIKLSEHIRKLPLGVLMGRQSGEIGNTMMNDFSRTESAMTHVLPQIISGALVAVLASVALIAADWRMGLAMFAGFPLALGIMLGMRGLERRLDRVLAAARVQQAAKLEEYLGGMRVIKAYHMQGNNFAKLQEACTAYRDACIRVERGVGPLNLLAAALLRSGLALMTLVGVFLVSGGSLAVPEFALFLLVGTRVFDPLAVAIMNYSELVMSGMAGERIEALMHTPEMGGSGEAPEDHEIVFEHVRFGYGDKDSVLWDVNARLAPGTMTALVGPSGSGKSTMLKLMARFYDPTAGRVCFGGVDARTIAPEKLMAQISVVFQDVYLFQDSVANNIRYGKVDATRAEIEKAARLANCYDFITQLADGFETMIGEGGSTLSGGEKQRIAIARAILKNAPVVLLDEATSSLDPENEAAIQEAIGRLVQGRTVVVIAHRLKTVVDADQILVLDQGHIVERGSHQSLLEQNGLYARLWQLQTESEGWRIQ